MNSDNDDGNPGQRTHSEAFGEVGYLLFDSLVHHLIEKGVLTKNDALSVVQAAEVAQSRVHENEKPSPQASAGLAILQRTYASFEALRARHGSPEMDGQNIHPLRPPLHGDRPQFPHDD